MVVKNPSSIPDEAKIVLKRIEALGFSANYNAECDLPDLSKRQQTRLGKHAAPRDEVVKYAENMKRGDKFPPITVTRDGILIDGHTRTAAAYKANLSCFPAGPG